MGNWSGMFITCKDEIIFSIVSFLVAKVRYFFSVLFKVLVSDTCLCKLSLVEVV